MGHETEVQDVVVPPSEYSNVGHTVHPSVRLVAPPKTAVAYCPAGQSVVWQEVTAPPVE